ncbi:MAG TPA: gliding motility protein GldN [Flavobacteriales bacterium]|nr:gliding motility protein GldN [Flavobacteriales bacterium]
MSLTMKSIIGTLLLSFILSMSTGYSQSVLDPKDPPSYPNVRYADLMWMKQVWRRIDLRQKMNHGLYFPERPSNGMQSLYDHLTDAVEDGLITAYSPGVFGDNDMFTDPMTASEFELLLVSIDTVYSDDPLSGTELPNVIRMETRASDIVMYEIKENWFFDRERSVMEVRIEGICPIISVKDELTGEFRGYKKLFWVHFPEARYELANRIAYNRENDVERRSFEEIFHKRIFDSYIVKESNVYNRTIQEYAMGEDALFEAQRVETKIFEMEHDLWSQ